MKTSPSKTTDARYADLAEIVLVVAREIRLREFAAGPEIALTPSHASVMRYIDAHPGSFSSDVADATGLTRSNLSTSVRRLEAAGFIERRVDIVDARGVRLYPTRTAAFARRKIRKQWSDLLAGALGTHEGVAEATAVLESIASELTAERRLKDLRAGKGNL